MIGTLLWLAQAGVAPAPAYEAPPAPPAPPYFPQPLADPDPSRFYTKPMRKAGARAVVDVHLSIMDGRVRSCAVTESSGAPELDAASCRAARTARYPKASTGWAGTGFLRFVWSPERQRVVHARFTRTPRLLPNTFTLSADDYPPEAALAGEEGTATASLALGAEGRPTACDIQTSSGSAALDAATCRLLMERARFEPGRDRFGDPVNDRALQRVRWRIPADEP